MPELRLGDAKIHYRDEGAGTPVVLLHSSAMSGDQWSGLIDDLVADYRVLAPDLYGYGRSDPWPESRPLTLEDESEIVAAMLARANAPAHVIGHSYGGAVAMYALKVGCGPVLSLTAYEPVLFQLLGNGDPQDLPLYAEIMEIVEAFRDGLAAGDNRRAMRIFVDFWSGAGSWDGLREEAKSDLACRAPKVEQDFTALLSDTTKLSGFAAVAVPTLLIVGGRTPGPTRSLAELLATALPDARLEAVVDAGHMGPVTHRDAINRLIATHLRRAVET